MALGCFSVCCNTVQVNHAQRCGACATRLGAERQVAAARDCSKCFPLPNNYPVLIRRGEQQEKGKKAAAPRLCPPRRRRTAPATPRPPPRVSSRPPTHAAGVVAVVEAAVVARPLPHKKSRRKPAGAPYGATISAAIVVEKKRQNSASLHVLRGNSVSIQTSVLVTRPCVGTHFSFVF